MRTRLLSSLASFLGALLLSSLSFGQEPRPLDPQEIEGQPVVEIELIGLQQITPKAVQALMQTRVGEPFRVEKLEADIRTLTAKVFSSIPSVSAELVPEKKGVVVTIAGGENRRLVGVVFFGGLEYRRDKLEPLVRSRRGGYTDDFLMEVDRREIQRFLVRQGHHFAQVSAVKNLVKGGDILVFRIVEGPKVHLRDVYLEGADSFERDELLREMPYTREPGFLGFSKQTFILEEVQKDEKQLTRYYRDRGFLNAEVTLYDWRFTSDNEDVDLFYRVREGEPFVVEEVALEGVTLFDTDTLRSKMKTTTGSRYEPGVLLAQDIRKLQLEYHRRGWVSARVLDESTYSLEDNKVRVVLRFVEGERVRVGNILIQGNVETRDNVLRRDIDLYPGDPLDLEKLERARRDIRRLGYWQIQPPDPSVERPVWSADEDDFVPGGFRFERVDATFSSYQIFRDAYLTLADTPQENVKDIIVTVREADTGSLRFAAGIGSNAGLVGDITYTKRNFDPFDFPDGFSDILSAFTGAGQYLNLSFQPGFQRTRWDFTWADPRLFDTRYSLSANFVRTVWLREDWEELRYGYGFTLGRVFGDDLVLSARLYDQVVDTREVDDDAPQLVFDFESDQRVVSLGLTARYDQREFRPGTFFDPVGGYVLNLNYDYAGLWGDIAFDRVRFQGDGFFELFTDDKERPHVIHLNGQAGWMAERGDTRDVPVFERFYLGGAGTLRGFRFRGVGPRDDGSPIGGKGFWLLGTEYSFPLLENQVRGLLFVDSGSLGLDWGDDSLYEPRVSVGFGVRMVIPFLGDRPIAIDFGFPVLRQDGDDTQLISFSFGSNF